MTATLTPLPPDEQEGTHTLTSPALSAARERLKKLQQRQAATEAARQKAIEKAPTPDELADAQRALDVAEQEARRDFARDELIRAARQAAAADVVEREATADLQALIVNSPLGRLILARQARYAAARAFDLALIARCGNGRTAHGDGRTRYLDALRRELDALASDAGDLTPIRAAIDAGHPAHVTSAPQPDTPHRALIEFLLNMTVPAPLPPGAHIAPDAHGVVQPPVRRLTPAL